MITHCWLETGRHSRILISKAILLPASYDDPGNFALNTTYYWRVDEIVGTQKRKGNVWSFTVTDTDSNYSLVGKIMCGYQGWFNCPGDGTSRGWVHWGGRRFYTD